MTFKVIITHNSEEGDEHIYYGSVYAARNFSQVKKLAFNSSLHRLEATFSFDDGQVPEGDNFLAVLVPVKAQEIASNTTPQWKMGTNTPKSAPEEVHFP
jgi:hypothetical protein